MNRNLTINMKNCNHRTYIPKLVELVRSGAVDPLGVLTKHGPLVSAIDAYRQFDLRANFMPARSGGSGRVTSPARSARASPLRG